MSDITVKQMIYNHEKAFQPEVAEGVNAVIQYRLTGEEGGDYIITIQDGKCTVAEMGAISVMFSWAKPMGCSTL
jgi:phenolic acid decarboxylase